MKISFNHSIDQKTNGQYDMKKFLSSDSFEIQSVLSMINGKKLYRKVD